MKDDHIVFRGEVLDLLDQRLLPLEAKRACHAIMLNP